jgi:hypothetical protein
MDRGFGGKIMASNLGVDGMDVGCVGGEKLSCDGSGARDGRDHGGVLRYDGGFTGRLGR